MDVIVSSGGRVARYARAPRRHSIRTTSIISSARVEGLDTGPDVEFVGEVVIEEADHPIGRSNCYGESSRVGRVEIPRYVIAVLIHHSYRAAREYSRDASRQGISYGCDRSPAQRSPHHFPRAACVLLLPGDEAAAQSYRVIAVAASQVFCRLSVASPELDRLGDAGRIVSIAVSEPEDVVGDRKSGEGLPGWERYLLDLLIAQIRSEVV
jgi:hypothetical protein